MERVVISPAQRVDATDLIRANTQSRDYHAPWAQPFTDSQAFDAWFSKLSQGANVGLVAREHLSREVIGVFNISQIVWGEFCSAYLGFYGSIGFARSGLMTEALRLTISHAFMEIGLHRLEANIQPGNLASIALVRRAGFQKEGFSPRYLKIGGVWRDHERWAVLADNP